MCRILTPIAVVAPTVTMRAGELPADTVQGARERQVLADDARRKAGARSVPTLAASVEVSLEYAQRAIDLHEHLGPIRRHHLSAYAATSCRGPRPRWLSAMRRKCASQLPPPDSMKQSGYIPGKVFSSTIRYCRRAVE